MWHWWGPLQTTLCFPVTAQPDKLMCIPLGQRKTFYTIQLKLQFRHMQRHVRWHVNMFQQSLHIIADACQNCVMMDVVAGSHLGDQTTIHWLTFQLQCLVKVKAGCWMPILKRFLQWRAGCAISGLSPKLLQSSPACLCFWIRYTGPSSSS